MVNAGWFRPWCLILVCLLGAPFAAKSQEITVNSTCEVGCPGPPPALGTGQSTSSSFNFNYTFGNGDVYNINGTYGGSYSSVNGSTLFVNPAVTYEGSAATTGLDTINFDMLLSYFDPRPGSWAGTYTETIPLQVSSSVGAGSNVSVQLL